MEDETAKLRLIGEHLKNGTELTAEMTALLARLDTKKANGKATG